MWRLQRNSLHSPWTPEVDWLSMVEIHAGSRLRERVSTYFGQMRSNVNSCKRKATFNALFCIGD